MLHQIKRQSLETAILGNNTWSEQGCQQHFHNTQDMFWATICLESGVCVQGAATCAWDVILIGALRKLDALIENILSHMYKIS